MSKLVAALTLMFALAMPAAANAQQLCATSSGTCAISGGTGAGGACACMHSGTLVQGTVHAAGSVSAPDNLPHYCCTPGGRAALANSSVRAGQACEARLPNGAAMTGQACY